MYDYESIDKISRQIAEKDGELASIFDSIIEGVMHTNMENPNSGGSNWAKKRLQNIENTISRFRNINAIPGIPSTSCHAYCVCLAFDKWHASKGFKGVYQSTIEYWLSCFKMNRGTLIFSFSWDDIDFIEKCKKSFDNYAKDPQHTVAVILIASNGISLQYINI